MKFNFKQSSSATLEQVELPTVLKRIKEGEYSQLIEDEKHLTPEFRNISLPYFKPTFNDSLHKLTQLIYGDITGFDNIEDVKDHLKRFPFIHSAWSSYDNRGIGLLIQCEGLTIDCFMSNWKEVQNILGLEFGPQTKRLDLKVIVPSDEDIYINENVQPFKAIQNDEVEPVNKSNKFIFQTQFSPEIFKGKDHLIFPNGIDFLKVYLPKDGIILNELRVKVLPAIIATIIQLNHETKSQEEILKLTYALNNKHCVKPFSKKVFYDIFNDIYQNHLDGTMEVKYIKRKLIFNPESNLSKKEKLTLAGQLAGKIRKDDTFNKLKSIVESLDKPTQVKVAQVSGCGIATVKRHWSKLKPFITPMKQAA
jgi:hypothetical protein